MCLLAVTVLPVRAVLAFLLIFVATCLACLGLHSLDPQQLDTRPFTGWRLWIRKVLFFCRKCPYFIFFYKTLEFSYDEQCCGAGRSRNFWLEPEPMKIRWLRAIFSQI